MLREGNGSVCVCVCVGGAGRRQAYQVRGRVRPRTGWGRVGVGAACGASGAGHHATVQRGLGWVRRKVPAWSIVVMLRVPDSWLTVCSVGGRTDHVIPAASVIRNSAELDALAFLLLPALGLWRVLGVQLGPTCLRPRC